VHSIEPFLTGFLENNNYVGRPVDVQPMKDGSLLVSDDWNGAVYRITYSGKPNVTEAPVKPRAEASGKPRVAETPAKPRVAAGSAKPAPAVRPGPARTDQLD
jgi:hypothetical protein